MQKFSLYISYFFYNIFAKYLPRSYKALKIGKYIRGTFARRILNYAGSNINVERRAEFSPRVSLGNNSGIGIRAVIKGKVDIGDNVLMGPDCTIYTRNHKYKSISTPIINQGYEKEEPVVIEDDVWIGGQVTILPGVRIKEGSVIAARTVVTKDVPSFAVYGGNPGKVIKYRKNTEIK